MNYDKEAIKNEIYKKLFKCAECPLSVQIFRFEYIYDSYISRMNNEADKKTQDGINNALIILTALKEIMLETKYDKKNQTIRIPRLNPYEERITTSETTKSKRIEPKELDEYIEHIKEVKEEKEIDSIESMSLNEYINRIRNAINLIKNAYSIENEDKRIITAAQQIIKKNPENMKLFLEQLEEKIQKSINKEIPKETILTLDDYNNEFKYIIEGKDSNKEFVNKIIKELETSLDKMSEEEREKLFKECGLVYEKIPNQKGERHHQLIRLKAALAALYVLNKQHKEPKTGMDEMIEMLGLQGCLIPSPEEEHINISQESLRILGAQIDEDIRQCEQAMQESVAQLIKEGPKL